MSDSFPGSGDGPRQSVNENAPSQDVGPAFSADGSRTHFKPLLESTQPQLYRHNAFRILGVSAYASERDIRRQIEKIEMMEKVGSTAKTGGLLPLDPPPTRDAVREAMQRLSDPERRFIEELFWFWPQDEQRADSDEAFAALAAGDTSRVTEIWTGQEKEEKNAVRATHNLAVLYHLTALDLELDALARSSTRVQESERNKEWQKAFSYWGTLVDDERFWIRLNKRVRELDDPRLTIETARRIRASLPLALLSINAQLALQAAQVGESATAHLHRYLISQSGFDQDAIDDALQRTAQPLRDQIRTSCQTARAKVEADPSEGEQVVRRLFDEAQPLLLTLDRLLPAGNSVRDGAHDEVTETARECLPRFANTLGNWKVAAEVLELFSEIPVAESERTDFKKDLALFRDNAEYQGLTRHLKPIKSAPGLYMNNGFGVKLFGHADYDANTRSYLATHYFVLFEIPVIPLGRYRVSSEGDNTYRFYGKAPFRTFDKIHLAVIVLAPVILFSILVYFTSNFDIASMARNKDIAGLASLSGEGATEARRNSARKALLSIVPNSKEDVETLLEVSKSGDGQAQNDAAEVLRRIDPTFTRSEPGRAVIPLLVAALDNAKTQSPAADTLGRFGPLAKEALPALEGVVKKRSETSEAGVRSYDQPTSDAVLKAIWKIRPNTPESVAMMVTALKSANRRMQRDAVGAVKDIDRDFLQSQAGSEIVAMLATVATDWEYDSARNEAQHLLEELGPAAESAVPVLEARLKEERRIQSANGEEVIINLLNSIEPEGSKTRKVLSKRKR